MNEKLKAKFEVVKPYPCLILFFVILFGMLILDLFTPDRAVSELENTKLKQIPQFSLSSLLSNKWTAQYADYVKDQVPLRDGWIGMQSRCEVLLLRKTEVGGILLGDDTQMFTKQFTLTKNEITQLPKNTQAVADFAARHPGQVTFLLAPSASLIYPEELPFAAPMLDENRMLDDIFSVTGKSAAILDPRSVFVSAKDDYIYYRTDHHWTTVGAYLAYEQFCQQQSLTPFDTSAHTAVEVPGFLGTHYSASRLYNAKSDTITYYELPNQLTLYNITGENTFEPIETSDLYDYSSFDTRDKYAAFLHGNGGYSTIEGDGKGSILVIKDSYANCFVPFLTANYAKIGIVDFRNYSYGIDSLIEAEGYDHILILYNFSSFKSDTRLPYLNRGI